MAYQVQNLVDRVKGFIRGGVSQAPRTLDNIGNSIARPFQQGASNFKQNTQYFSKPQNREYAPEVIGSGVRDLFKNKGMDPVSRFGNEAIGNLLGSRVEGVTRGVMAPFTQKPLANKALDVFVGGLSVLPTPVPETYRAFSGVYPAVGAVRSGGNVRDAYLSGLKGYGTPSQALKGTKLASGTTGGNILDTADLVLGLTGRGIDDKSIRAISRLSGKLGGKERLISEAYSLLNENRGKIGKLAKTIDEQHEIDKAEKALRDAHAQFVRMPKADMQKLTINEVVKDIQWFYDQKVLPKLDQAQGFKMEIAGDQKLDPLIQEAPKGSMMGFVGDQPTMRVKSTPLSSPTTKSASRGVVGKGSTEPTMKIKGQKSFDSQQYIKEQAALQSATPERLPLRTRADTTLQSIKTKFEDFTTPIETALNRAEKKGKFKILPEQDIRYQIDKVLRADSLGTQFVKDNGLESVIKNTDDLDSVNQYLIAKQASDVSSKGIKTGRDITKDQQLIQDLAPKYEAVAQQVYSYNAKLRSYLVESGLISQDLSNTLAKEYPNYVPLKRIFTEVEEQALRSPSGRGGPASIGSQSVVKRLKGSDREITNPLESLLENTGLAFREGERNKGANMLGKYIEGGIIPGKEIKGTVGAKHTISFLDGGKKRVFEVSPEIAAAAKNLNADQLSQALRIVAIPTRALQLGATGVNVPFIVGNLVKDQVTAAVISKKPLSTSILNPANFVKALFSSVRHDKLYDDWVRSGGAFTSYDMSRGAAPNTIRSIRSTRNVGSKIKYLATNPIEILRALEDTVGTTEKLTRIQQYAGTKQALLAEGRTALDADILAGAASRTNTANFARKGEYGKVLNSVIPFFNAGIQGARSLRQAFMNDPKGTSLRFTATVGIPIATATLWNLSNYERKAAYEDVSDYEKENNIIIMPEKPVKDEKGYYNAIKIPITPGLANLGSIIRRQIEGVGVNAQEIAKVLSDLSAANTSFELPISVDSTRKLASTVTPQGVKLMLEPTLNKNFFTGEDIVPSYMQNKPVNEQVRDYTSGTARKIGGVLKVSPLKVENMVSSAGAGAGRQLLNLSDRALAKAGIIPSEQIGGRGITEDTAKRFIKVKGGETVNKLYEAGLSTKQIEKLMEEEKASTAKFSDTREESPEAPKTIMGRISLASKGIVVDPKNTIKALFTEEVMRKITNDALIFERKTNINPGTEGYAVDHTIPLSLGGDNSPENLVVYPNETKAIKDKLEYQLWRKLDAKEIGKKEAQAQITAFINKHGAGDPISKTSKEYVKSIASGKESVPTLQEKPVKGKSYNWVDGNGKDKTLSIEPPTTPTYTGNKELDKKLKSKHSGEVTKIGNNIIKLYEAGTLTADEAGKAMDALATAKAKGKKGKKGRKGRKTAAVKFAKIKNLKAPTGKLRFGKLPKPKKTKRPSLTLKSLQSKQKDYRIKV